MVFQSTATFHRLSSYMVHPTKSLASVGLAQARPNKGSSKDKTAMHLLRCLWFFAALFQIRIIATHIPGIANTAADLLSRNGSTSASITVPIICAYTSANTALPKAIGLDLPGLPVTVSRTTINHSQGN